MRRPLKRRRLPPAPKALPEGMMYYHGRVLRVEQVEQFARFEMKGFDDLLKRGRMVLNAVPHHASELQHLANKSFKGDLSRAADWLLIANAGLIVKARKRRRA